MQLEQHEIAGGDYRNSAAGPLGPFQRTRVPPVLSEHDVDRPLALLLEAHHAARWVLGVTPADVDRDAVIAKGLPQAWSECAGLGLVVGLMVGHVTRGERPTATRPHPVGRFAGERSRPSGDRTTLADLPAATQGGILDAMRQARRVEGSDTLAFTNPAQRLDAAIAPDRVRMAGTAGAQVQFLTPALGRPGTLTPMTMAPAVGTGTARVELSRTAGAPAVTEWWSHDATGLEQGFVVHERPRGHGPLVVRQPYDTDLAAALADEGRTVVFTDASGARLRYAGLKAWDATGRSLEAHVVLEASALIITTADADAVYPVTIDPRWCQEAYLKASNTDAGGGEQRQVRVVLTRGRPAGRVAAGAGPIATIRPSMYATRAFRIGRAVRKG